VIRSEQILSRLLSVEGITGNESGILAETASICDELGLQTDVSPAGIILRAFEKNSGPSLLFCSHLDTVPAGIGWTVPPFKATFADSHLFGRGAVDARGSCAAIIMTAAHYASIKQARGQFIGILSIGEEGNKPSLPILLEKVTPVDAGIVGEPTSMKIVTAQRGLMVLELSAQGKQGHASRASDSNSILTLAHDLIVLEALKWLRPHRTLGAVKITPTRLQAGVADNVAPPLAAAVLDLRTTPSYTHKEILAIVRSVVRSELRVIEDQWIPCETPENHPLVIAAKEALGESTVTVSYAASDWVFLHQQGIPAIMVGPGNPAYSHAPDERISIDELEAGVRGYIRIAETLWNRFGAGS